MKNERQKFKIEVARKVIKKGGVLVVISKQYLVF
jgi:hypothetical protein